LKHLKLPGDELVLVAGCGTGRLTAELLKRLPEGRVIAVDHSENMLRAASEYLSPRFGDRLMFVRADLQSLRMEERVDGIFTCSVPVSPGVFSRFITTEPSPSSTCSSATLVPSPAGSAKRLIYAVC
jgi:trans-aconitate methyltransferase